MSDFDVSEIRKLERDLGAIPGRMVAPLVATVTKSAKALQRAMRADARGHAHTPHFPASITTDVTVKVGQIEAEVGPDKSRKQGALGNILYFGTSKNGAVLDLNGPLDAQAPKFQKAVEDTARKLL